MAKTYSAGVATAYGAAVRGGYTGTYEDFCKDQAEFAENAQQVATDRAAVQAIASTFENTTVPNATAAIQAEGQSQIVNVIGAGNTQIAAVNNTATTQIQNIQAEGTAQVGRVQIAVTAQVDRAESAANDASEYASTASASKNAAQASETNAANSATAAAASATAAADSATTANTKAGEAASFATAAADSATDAAAAKTAAETAQGKAETAQGEAETAAQSVSASAAQITQNAEDIGDLRSAFSLFQENIPGTVQTIAFDSAGNIQSVTHKENNVVVRTDVFTFAASTITEVRTLASGESLTIVTNTDTLETTTTHAAA